MKIYQVELQLRRDKRPEELGIDLPAERSAGGFLRRKGRNMDDEKRNRPVSFNVTPHQHEQIERAAASEGLATASYVRRLVVTHLKQNHPVAA
jgi:hypothetical protein